MIRIKYRPNPQGIKEVEIQPQLVDSPIKKNKENKKRSEQKKNSLKQKEEKPKVVPTSPKKMVWKQKDAPKSTSTPPKSNKMVWDQRRCNHPRVLLQARMYHPQARNEGRRVLLIGL